MKFPRLKVTSVPPLNLPQKSGVILKKKVQESSIRLERIKMLRENHEHVEPLASTCNNNFTNEIGDEHLDPAHNQPVEMHDPGDDHQVEMSHQVYIVEKLY